MSGKYLFLLSSLPPSRSANGLCVKKVMSEFSDLKDVFAITFDDGSLENDLGIAEIRIPLRPWDRMTSLILKSPFFIAIFLRCLLHIKRFVMLPIWPTYSFSTVLHFYKSASRLVKRENISHIIAVCYPGETLLALCLLKIRFGKRIKTIMYPLDATLGGKYDGFLIERKLSVIFSGSFYKFCSHFTDRIIVLENAIDLFESKLPKQKDKFMVCGLPLVKNDASVWAPINKQNLQFVYGGNIIKAIRNPDYLFEFLNECAEKKGLGITIKIYGSVDKSLLDGYISKYKCLCFEYYGWVAEEVLTDAINQANALISVGNSVAHLIPSKLFKYISLKKPIIHLYFIDDDPCIPYLNKYGYSFFIKIGDSFDVQKFCAWLDSLTSEISMDCEKTFESCTPRYTAKRIEIC